jgi:hypothetical protein
LPLFQTIQKIYRQGGWRGFYKGLGHGTLGNSIFYGTYFYLNSLLNRVFGTKNGFYASYLSAGCASTLNNIFHVYKTHHQVEVLVKHPLLRGDIKRQWSKWMFRGLGWTWVKNVELGLIMRYRHSLEEYIPVYLPSKVVSTFLIKWSTTTLTYPLDTARVLSRTEALSLPEIYRRLSASPRNAYRGYILYSTRSVPSTVIAFCTYDWLTSLK